MGLKKISEHLNGLVLFQPETFGDDRGFFMESYREDQFRELGLPTNFVQDNHSRSRYGTLRGMHFQWDPPQGKLLRVTRGEAFVAEIDIRVGSPTFGSWFGATLSERNKRILWIPPGFANGFCALSSETEVQYKCTAFWNKRGESNIVWNDADVGIYWPLDDPILSEKDAGAQTLAQWLDREEAQNFKYGG